MLCKREFYFVLYSALADSLLDVNTTLWTIINSGAATAQECNSQVLNFGQSVIKFFLPN